MFVDVLAVITPVLLIAAAGFGWSKAGGRFDGDTLSSLVMMIGTPCLVFSTLTGTALDLAQFGEVFLAAALVIGGSLLIGFGALKLAGWPVDTYLTSLTHPNTGNMGLPLVLLAFGDTGLALGIAYFFVNSISQYTLGIGIASGSFHPASVLRQPIIWSLVAVLAVLGFDLPIPGWLAATTELLGGFVIPAMLLLLGNSLAKLSLADSHRAVTIALLRLAIGVATGVAVIWILDLDGVLAGVVFLQSAMPAAVFNYIFAERFGRSPERVAGVILASTTVGVLTLPVLVGVALTIAG